MKRISKNLVSLFLILIVALSVISPLQAGAATKGKVQNVTMYVGEAYEYTNYSKVKSIKNTKKSVVEAAKREDNDNYVLFQARKAGKTKITAKTQSGTAVFNITVKESDFEYKLYTIGRGEILAEITNKTKAIFESGKFRYTLKGTDGAECASEEKIVNALIPNTKSYVTILFNASAFEPDVSQSEMKMVSLSRSPNRRYVNADKKLEVKDEIKSQTDKEVVVSVNTKNTGKTRISGNLYIIFYDPSGLPIGIVNKYIGLKAGSIDTSNATEYLSMINFDTGQREVYGSYEIIRNVYTNEIKK